MAKIIPLFKDSKADFIEKLEEALEMAKRGEFDNFLFAAKCKDGNVLTGWANLVLGERQELISHMQIDIMIGVVEENIDRVLGNE